MICEKCEGTGKIKVEKPVSMTEMGEVEEDCDLCGGTGELPDTETLLHISVQLDRIIELLEGINDKRN